MLIPHHKSVNFQSLPTVPTSQELIDKALSRGRKRGDQLKGSLKTDKQKRMSLEKISTIRKVAVKDLTRIINAFPNFENLPEFYEQLCISQFDLDKARESLGRLQGTIKSINRFSEENAKRIKYDEGSFSSYAGRISSIIRKVNSALKYLAKVRDHLISVPTIKDDIRTVALAGFPNVGKSTLLAKITTSKPKIANYAFTTKTLNTGYYKEGYNQVQVIDTPGTLARFEKMNSIEQMAYLALKYVADVIVMILDPTDTYTIKEQEKLLEQIKKHDKQIIVYVSKTDIADVEKVKSIQHTYPEAVCDADKLKLVIKSV